MPPRRIASETPTFESLLAQLETLVARLESGNLTLEESLQAYEQGMHLAKQCGEMLDRAELKVKELAPAPGEESQPDELDAEAQEEA